jgi:hypothetical protein
MAISLTHIAPCTPSRECARPCGRRDRLFMQCHPGAPLIHDQNAIPANQTSAPRRSSPSHFGNIKVGKGVGTKTATWGVACAKSPSRRFKLDERRVFNGRSTTQPPPRSRKGDMLGDRKAYIPHPHEYSCCKAHMWAPLCRSVGYF